MENSNNSDNLINSNGESCEPLTNDTDTELINQSGNERDVKTFSKRTVAVTASRLGISDLSEDVCQHIANELYYKTKELIYVAKYILNQNKNNKLTSDDVNKAMKIVGGVQIYGHNSKEESNFILIPKADVYVEDDPELEIVENALSDAVYSYKGDPYIQGAWVMPEEITKECSGNTMNISSYYLKMAKAIMIGKIPHKRVAITDLRSNPKIGPDCPYFLNLVALTVKKAPRDVHLNNVLINTVHSIAHNKYVDPSLFLAVNRAVNSLLKIVIEVKIENNYDDLPVRLRAGLLLAKVVILWSIELDQQIEIVGHLLQHLLDNSVPLQSHYGAIVALTALGQRTLDFYFWPVMERYLPQLESRVSNIPNILSQYIMGAILIAARSTYKKGFPSEEQFQKLSKVDKMLFYSFGDSVTPMRIAYISDKPVYPCFRSTLNLPKLKLRMSNKNYYTVKREPIPMDKAFKLHHGATIARLKALYYDSVSPKPFKLHYPFVARNLKSVKQFSKNSSTGDTLLLL